MRRSYAAEVFARRRPPSIIRQRFKEDLKSDVVEALVPRYFRKEAEKQGLVPVSQPRVTDLHIHEGEPLRFKAVFEVYPDLEITNYVGIPVQQVASKVEDSEVEASLKKLQEEMAELVPVEEDRPIKAGDFAEISFSGTTTSRGANARGPRVSPATTTR